MVGERRVLLGVSRVLTVRLVLTAGGVRREVRVVGVVRRLAVVVLVMVATASPAPCAGGVLVGAGGPGLLTGVAGHAHQTLLREGLLEDALVKAAERSAEIFKVREAERLVPRLGDG